MSSSSNPFSSLLITCAPLAKLYGKLDEYESLSKLLEHCFDKNLTLLVCGEFKKGKSSLINALLNEEVCPVADGIATSAVSIIKYGRATKVTRSYSTIQEDTAGNSNMVIKNEVVEYGSISGYAKGSSIDIDNTLYLEIEIPNEYLHTKGLTIIDTPGIGSLDPRHLFLTLQALPKADAILFVTDTTEPLSTTELDFLRDRVLPLKKPVDIILSKSDHISRDQLAIFKKDAEEKVLNYCGIKVGCVPVSSTEWDEFNKTDDDSIKERRKKNSNCDAVFYLINTFFERKVSSIEEIFRIQYLDFLESLKTDIEKSISELSSGDNASDIQTYRCQLEEIKSLRDMILNDDSEFRGNINTIIETSQEHVFEDFSRESVLLSSEKLEKVLKDPRALEEDGDKFVVNEMNHAIQQIGADIDRKIDVAISDVLNELKDFIDNVQLTNKTSNTQVEGEIVPISHSFSENFVNLTRQALPFMGVATISGGLASFGLGLGAGILGLSTAALPIIGVGVGIAAGLFYVVQSIKGTRRQETLNNIRKQVSPRISIAMNEMRAYIQKRYSILSKEVVKTLKSVAKSMTEQMQEKVKLLQECEKDVQKRNNALKEHQKQLNMVNNLLIQTKVLNTRPFSKS